MLLSEIMSLSMMRKKKIAVPECIVEEIKEWKLPNTKLYQATNIAKIYCYFLIYAVEKPLEISIVDLMDDIGFGDEQYVTNATKVLEGKHWISIERNRNPYIYRVITKK